MAPGAGSAERPNAFRQGLPYAGLLIGVWAAAAPYVLLGPDLNAAAKNEFADHVVPGLLTIVLSAAMIARTRSATSTTPTGSFPLLAGFGVLLAGLWMTATHFPLVKDARNDLVATDVTAWHTVPGLVVLALGAGWAAAHWSDAADQPVPDGAAKAKSER
ncbi:MAG TPA: hypothetical protein VHM89_11600 [Acidimicrobiales bacterium]|nr:hypothetical protein [Acidimicrobiales bacterium]